MSPGIQHLLKAAFVGAIFVGAGLPLLISILEGVPYAWVAHQRGLLFAVLGVGAGLVVGFITIPTTIEVTVPDRSAFLQKLQQAMVELRYEPITQSESFLAFRFSGGLKAVAPPIAVHIEAASARITGPKNHISKLRSRV